MSKKQVFVLITVLYAGLLMFLHARYIEIPWVVFFAAIAAFLVFCWYRLVRLFEYSIIIPKLIFFVLVLLGNILFLFFFPTLGIYVRSVYVIFTSIMVYVLLLSINVYFVSEKQQEDIPLLQPAKLVVFINIILSVFMWGTVLYKIPLIINEWPEAINIAVVMLFLVFYSALFYSTQWYFLQDRVGELSENALLRYKSAFRLGIIVLWQISIVLMLYPFETFARSVLLSAVTYVVINLLVHYASHKINKKVFIESILILFIVYILVYLV